jgi:hypothetical protein
MRKDRGRKTNPEEGGKGIRNKTCAEDKKQESHEKDADKSKGAVEKLKSAGTAEGHKERDAAVKKLDAAVKFKDALSELKAMAQLNAEDAEFLVETTTRTGGGGSGKKESQFASKIKGMKIRLKD